MQRTTTLRRQHEALQALSAQLFHAMATIETDAQARTCALILGKMTGLLTVHLAAEDRSLYPRMEGSGDPDAARIARDFAAEMGGLAATYAEFAGRWRSGSAILGDVEGFRTEAALVLYALERRITRENDELYPLADRMVELRERTAA